MKYLSYIFLPPLLIALVIAALVGPKYLIDANLMSPPNSASSDQSSQQASDYQKHIQPFIAKLDAGDLTGAKSELEKLSPVIPEDLETGLQLALVSAQTYQQKIIAAENISNDLTSKLATTENELAQSQNRISQLEEKKTETENRLVQHSTELARMRSDIADLMKAAQAAAEQAEISSKELTKLREAIDSGESAENDSLFPANLPKSFEPLIIPGPLNVQFRGKSTAIPSSVRVYVEQIGEWLGEDSRLGIQVRGRFQTGFSDEENKTLVETRVNNVEQFLTQNGASEEQIKVVLPDIDTDISADTGSITDAEPDTDTNPESDVESNPVAAPDTGSPEPPAASSEEKTEIPADPIGYVELIFFER